MKVQYMGLKHSEPECQLEYDENNPIFKINLLQLRLIWQSNEEASFFEQNDWT